MAPKATVWKLLKVDAFTSRLMPSCRPTNSVKELKDAPLKGKASTKGGVKSQKQFITAVDPEAEFKILDDGTKFYLFFSKLCVHL